MTRRILIVDDDREMVRTLRDILQLRGWHVGEAYSGQEAIDIQTEQPYDCILMDIKMPGMNGVEAARVLRERFPALPIVLMTAHAAAPLDHEGFVLTKPLNLARLFELIEGSPGTIGSAQDVAPDFDGSGHES